MATIEYLHVCDLGFIAEGGKHCVIGIFERIYSPSFPAGHPSMTVAMRVSGPAHETLVLRIELVSPNGEDLATLPLSVTLDSTGTYILNLKMVGTQFPEPGRYVIKVSECEKTLISHPLQLEYAQLNPFVATPSDDVT